MATDVETAKQNLSKAQSEFDAATAEYNKLVRAAFVPGTFTLAGKEQQDAAAAYKNNVLDPAKEKVLNARSEVSAAESVATPSGAVSFPVSPQGMAESTPVTNASLPAITEQAKQAAASIVGPDSLGDEAARIGEYSRLADRLPFLAVPPLGPSRGGLGTTDGKAGPGAAPPSPQKTQVKLKTASGAELSVDLRVKIKPPTEYLVSFMGGKSNDFIALDGIVFPYTPSISYNHKADYTYQGPLHSNFTQYFYKNSSVSAISISGKFTVQNDQDAYNFLSAVHILRALTKMRSGGFNADNKSGSPPPVCKLEGYGKYMFSGVPIVIGDFKVENADSIDYYNFAQQSDKDITSVPTVSTISVTCIPMYSRQEMQKFNIPDFLNKYNETRTKGYI